MSVYMTLRARGDVAELERRATANPEGMRALVDSALANGLISHRFLGTDDGDIMVLDEWQSREGFETFFASNPQIRTMMGEVGVTEPPQITFWRELDTHDEVGPGPSAANEALVRRFFEELCSGGRLELAHELVSDDYVSHGPHAPAANGPDELIERVRVYQDSLEGVWTIDEITSAGDRVTARWTGTGRHVAELMGIPATGAQISVEAITVMRIADGRIAEEWTVWDALGLLQQLGAVPVPA